MSRRGAETVRAPPPQHVSGGVKIAIEVGDLDMTVETPRELGARIPNIVTDVGGRQIINEDP